MDKMLPPLFANILSEDYTMGRLWIKTRHISLCVIKICQIYIKKAKQNKKQNHLCPPAPPPLIALLPHETPECTKLKVRGEGSVGFCRLLHAPGRHFSRVL